MYITYLNIDIYLKTVVLGIVPNNSSNVSPTGRPQNFLQNNKHLVLIIFQRNLITTLFLFISYILRQETEQQTKILIQYV